MLQKNVINKLRKAELVHACEEAGLETNGTVAQLKERLIAHHEPEQEGEDVEMEDAAEAAPKTSNENSLPALVYNVVNLDPEATEQEAVNKSKRNLKRTIDEEGLSVRRSRGGKFAANEGGFTLMKAVEENAAIIAEIQGAVAQLQMAREDDRCGNEGYAKLRNRFISGYKRIVGSENVTDAKILKSGNGTARGGDPVYDASLYADGIRADKNVFIELYGMTHERVRKFKEKRLLSILADHAWLRVNHFRDPPSHLFDQFDSFVKAFAGDGYKEDTVLSTSKTRTQREFQKYWLLRSSGAGKGPKPATS